MRHSCGPLHTDKQVLGVRLELIYNSSVWRRCSLEDLPNTINDRDEWRGKVWEIRSHGTTWWWYIFPIRPSAAQARRDTRSTFKQNVGIPSFPFPRLVTIPRLKNQVFPSIYPKLEGEQFNSYLFLRLSAQCEMLTASTRIWTRVAKHFTTSNNQVETIQKLRKIMI